jgi:hypothetical protein
MLELRWLDHIAEQRIEGGIKLLQELKWNLSVTESNAVWFVQGGDQTILKASSRESVDAFLYGMALAYSVIPEEILSQFRAWTDKQTQ